MATPIINNMLLPGGRILVLPDEGDKPSTGIVVRRSMRGGGIFKSSPSGHVPTPPPEESDHVVFVREMAVEVEIDGINYLAMAQESVVGIIPD